MPPLRAMGQLDDPVFLGVVLRSVVLSVALFVALAACIEQAGHRWLHLAGWLAGTLGGVAVALLAWLAFLPVAGLVASLFADRVAVRVEQRFYPDLPPGRPAPLAAQAWDGVVLGLQVLLLQVLAWVLAPVLLGASLPLGWIIAAWAIGRGLFVAVAMRRMTRREALALYGARRATVVFQGLLVAAGSLVPFVNLLVPVLGVAAMVHVLHGGPRRPADSTAGLSLPTPLC
jgi:uncharacterized protein involved in cysteine biosynthesis